MENEFLKRVLTVKGMSCASCEMKIENKIRKKDGIKEVQASLAHSRVSIEFDPNRISEVELTKAIQELGYEVVGEFAAEVENSENSKKFSINQLLGLVIIIFAAYFIINSTVGFDFIPQVDRSVGYGMLFVAGLLTSLHCIAMCGGINLSQCISQRELNGEEPGFAKLRPSLLYNSGRVVSYTVIGGIVGALGSVVGFSGTSKGMVAIIAGVFMVVMGINMLDVFPWLKWFNLRVPKFFGTKVMSDRRKHGPFVIGLLNGMMPCGPLQTMQLYALGTGNFLAGAISMFIFCLGTVPLMFGFGAISSILSEKFTSRMMKASAVLVIILGLLMMTRGLSLSGISMVSTPPATGSVAKVEGDVQVVTTEIQSGQYSPIVVQKGIPVRWIINAKAEDLNGCNNPITIPKYGIEKRLVPGENIIEFTPDAEGNITYTCWMGMITSTIKVVPDLSQVSGSGSNALNQDGVGVSGGSCCSAGAQTTRFAGGRIPTDDLYVAKVENGVQVVTIKVNDQGYSPAAVVLQKGAKVKIKFIAESLNYCNNVVQFPEYQGQMDLSKGQLETNEFKVTQDFTFRCWMGMLNGYFKVVEDISRVDLEKVKSEIQSYRPANGGGCCGG